jgi:hypothetical protein
MATATLPLLLGGCQGPESTPGYVPNGGFLGVAGAGGVAGAAGTPVVITGGSAGAPSTTMSPAFGGTPGLPPAAIGGATGVPAASGGAPGSAGAPGAGGASMGGAAGAGGMAHDDCMDGELPDPSDAMLTDMPDEWMATTGEIDLVVPKPVLGWMGARLWEVSHDAWHNVRRCKGGGAPPTSTAICAHTELIPAQLECSDAEDGYEFLVTQRHMLMSLKQAVPQLAER